MDTIRLKLAGIAAVLMTAGPVLSQVTIPGCGYLNGPECTITDYEFWNNGSAGVCDYGLAKSNGTCVMGTGRESLPYDQSWVVWAMNNQQRYSIGLDLQLDQILTVGTHNSYSSYREGFGSDLSTDQVYSITDQLQWGMRSIRIDPAHYWGNWRVCHGATASCPIPGISSDRLLSYTVKELADWLNAHPNEVIYLIINGHNDDPTSDWESILTTYIPPAKFFTPSDYSANGGWPTMRTLLNNHKQVVLFSFHQISDIGFSKLGDFYGVLTSDPVFYQCKAYAPCNSDPPASSDSSCAATDISQRAAPSDDGSPIFVSAGEDRTGSVATSNWGVMDEDQIQTAARCGYSLVQLDFVNNLDSSFYTFKENRPDTRREAAVWSWAPGDYGTLGPAVMRPSDGRWTSAASGANYPYACAVNTDQRTRTWYVSTASGPWTNGDANCTVINPKGHFAFPRNGKENADLHNVQVQAGGGNIWLNYSAQNGGSAILVTSNPVPVVHNGSAIPPLVFDVSTTVPVPASTGVVLSFSMDLGNGTETDGTTIYSPSTIRTFYLPDSWHTSKPVGSYTSSAQVSILDVATGNTLAQASVSFTIVVQSASGTSVTALTGAIAEGSPAALQINVTPADSNFQPPLPGTVSLFELVFDSTSQANVPQTIAGPFAALSSQDILLPLSPGTHQIGAKFTSSNPFLLGSASSAVTQIVTSYIHPTPSSLTFTMRAGGSLAAPQSFSGQSATVPPTITSNVNWMAPFSTSGQGANFTAAIRPTPAAQSLSPGQYTGQIMVADGVHAAQTVAVTLNVVGTLQLSTNSVSALTSGAVVTTEVDLLQGGTLPLQLQFPHGHPSWLSVEVIPQPSNPLLSGLLVTFNPQNVQPGQYPSGVTVASTLATQPVNLDITLTVVPLVTIDANVAGVSATIDNISYTLPHTFTWAPQSQHAISTTSPQGDSSVRYVFDHWSSGGAISQTITAPARFTDTSAWHASFNTWWALQATAVPGADGAILLNPQPTGGFYPDQTVVSVSAAPLVGFAFAGFSGDLSGTASPQNLKMDRARSISAAFVQAPVQVTIASSVPHLNVVIDGGAYTTPAVFVWGRYTSHTVVFQPVIAGATGVKYRFQSWNDTSAPPARVISVGASAATFTASFTTQYYLTASPSPADGGTVTGGGWHDAGTIAALSASAAQGFRFAGFSGDATGSTSPLNVAMDRAKTVAANFGPNGQPVIYAAPAGPDTDANGDHVVPIKLTNVGQGAAIGAQITSITNITVTSGSGQVTAAGLPVGVGDLAPGSSAAGNLLLQWPATATRIQMKVHFSANGGAYTGSTILNLFR